MFTFPCALLLFTLTIIQASDVIYLEDCTYAIDLYQEHLNLLWSSTDAHTLHIQAVYSLTSNKTLIPGHIYSYLSQSVALIPFLVRCKRPDGIYARNYLPFTRCSSTISNFFTKKNYESTRTYLNLKDVLSLTNVPLLYSGKYNLILFNCSFRSHSNTYQLQVNDIFKLHIEYETSINDNITSCRTCNKRTSICEDNRCICRKGTVPLKLAQTKEYCIDATFNCSYDLQRCLKSTTPIHHKKQFILILILFLSVLSILFLVLLWCLYRKTSKHVLKKEKDLSSNQSIFTINRHERTPSTISTTDSIKLNDYNQIDQHILANEYVSTFYDDYPKIISDRNNADLVLILA